MKVKIFMTPSKYKQYVKEVSFYNSTLEVGITQCFTNGYSWYKCNDCSFISKQKFDVKRHYSRIHIHNKKPNKQKINVIDFEKYKKTQKNAEKHRKNDRKLNRTTIENKSK